MNQAKNPKARQDEFVLARWHFDNGAKLIFVEAWNGKPMINHFGAVGYYMAYKWNSYHAARKYQKAHPCLAGYTVFNLTELQAKASAAKDALELVKFDPRS